MAEVGHTEREVPELWLLDHRRLVGQRLPVTRGPMRLRGVIVRVSRAGM